MKPWLLAVYQHDIGQHLELAQSAGWGLELQAFAHPQVLEDWRPLLNTYRRQLQGFAGPLALHGAFFDMSVHSEDTLIIEATRSRFLRNLDIAAELGARHVIFHTNFLPMLRHPRFREQWLTRNVRFWQDFAKEAAQRGVTIALENMWDPDPFLLEALMLALEQPNIRVCLDVSHAWLYGNAYPLETWLTTLAPYVVHVHLNNTDGNDDNHLSLTDLRGIIPYAEVLRQLDAVFSPHTWAVIELDHPERAAQSLQFVQRQGITSKQLSSLRNHV